MATPRKRNRASDRRRAAATLALLLSAAGLGAPGAVYADDGQSGATSVSQATLGVPVSNFHLLGASGDEIWGYGQLKAAPAIVDGKRVPAVAVGPPGIPSEVPAVFVVYRPSTGWLVTGNVTNAAGGQLGGTGFRAFEVSENIHLNMGSMQPSGAAAVFGGTGSTNGIAVRSPGGAFRFVPVPVTSAAAANILGNDLDVLKPIQPALESAEDVPEPVVETPATEAETPNSEREPRPTTPASAMTEDEVRATPAATTPNQRPKPTTPTEADPDTPVGDDAAVDVPPSDATATTPRDATATTPTDATATTPPTATEPAPAPTATAPDAAATMFDEPTARAVPVPNAKLEAGEEIVTAARQILLAVDEPTGRAGAFIGVQHAATNPNRFEESVLHWDGNMWIREPIELPAALRVGSFTIVSIAGTGLDNAWLLGRASAASGSGLVLFKRALDGTWQQQSLGTTQFADAAPAGTGVTGIAPLTGVRSQPLTVTTNGLWIDGSFLLAGEEYPFTVYFDSTARQVRGTWCDAPVAALCLNPLGAGFDTTGGYRSFAWAGGGPFGQRVITNPLRRRGAANTGGGTRLALNGTRFKRVRGLGGGGPGAAFGTDPNEGWLAPSGSPGRHGGMAAVRVTRTPDPSRVLRWPVPARKPLLAVAAQPGKAPADPGASAVAVGVDGTIVRYEPGIGWTPDAVLNGDGVRQTPELRSVAWPEQNRIHAVGGSEMWMYREAAGLWEPDPAKPLDFDGNLLGVAFQPDDASRGFAVGRGGLILRYGKTWERQALPDAVKDADILAVTFAGRRAYAVWRSVDGKASGVLVNDGGEWQIDADASALMESLVARDQTESANLVTVAGLPDGGVVAAGNNVVIKRDGPGSPWQLTNTPITDTTAITAAAIREDGQVRAVLVVYPENPELQYPALEVFPERLPGDPPFLVSNLDLPLGGVVLRETAAGGWSDQTHGSLPSGAGGYGNAQPDNVADTDQIYALVMNADGTQGWAVGGAVVRRNADNASDAADDRRRRRTAAAFRYPAGPNDPQPPTGRVPIPLDRPVARLAIGGHAACKYACADSENIKLAADVGLTNTLSAAGEVAAQVGGPRAFIYTGTRLEQDKLDDDEAQRFAQVASGPSNLPFYGVRATDGTGDGEGAYQRAFAGFPAPFGGGAAPNGITPLPTGSSSSGGAKTYYAFDSDGLYGKVRVIAIDNASGSLSAADPAQQAWLVGALDDAKANGVPAIVVGNRSLDPGARGQNPATDAAEVAQLLLAHGASAYFYDAPGINLAGRIPAGAPEAASIPAFGSGTLGYGSTPPPNDGLAYFGEGGYLLTEIDTAKRNGATNVAPVGVRLIPVIDQVALDPMDGTLLRRSKVAQFRALGRRPEAGGIDPYTEFPSNYCQVVFCAGRINPEYVFSSSRPDIANFVQRDTRVSDPKAVFRNAQNTTVADSLSGLVCGYNAGTANLTIAAGGRSYTQRVTVQAGAVAQPCGTVKLEVAPTRAQGATATPPPPAGAPPADSPAATPVSIVPPPPPPAAPVVPSPPTAPPVTPPAPPAAPPVPAALVAPVIPILPLVPPSIARPLPPPTPPGVPVSQPVPQVEEKREEEEAYESQSAFAQALPSTHRRSTNGGLIIAVLALGAGGGAIIVRTRRRPRPMIAQAGAYSADASGRPPRR